jgi:hypothetical protein
MRQRASIAPAAAVILAACAGGTTMRVADQDSSGDEPVSLAPVPDTSADTATVIPAPAVAAGEAPVADSSEIQGYGGYAAEKEIQLRRIGQWSHTGIGEARRLVIRDANGWAQFWAELGVGERPELDFNQNLAIAVASGQRPSGGHEIAVQRVTRTGGQLTIHVLETTPGPNCLTTSALTQPVDVVAVPRDGAVGWSFVESREVRACR